MEKNTHQLLDLLDSACTSSSIHHPASSIQATFFILGWIAERLPHLVREIHNRGHEVASHGYNHELCNNSTFKDLSADLTHSKALLEDIIGDRIHGYRAPSFSINNDILTLIKESGYLYDSSYNSFGMHERYGQVDLTQYEKEGIASKISKIQNPQSKIQHSASNDQNSSSLINKFKIENSKFKILYELPISNISMGKRVLPWGGGGYFRLTPFPIFRLGIQSILRKENAYLFYCHPWEFDDKQPRVNEAAFFYKFRHYVNLDKTRSKLLKLIESFKDCSFISCKQYLDSNI